MTYESRISKLLKKNDGLITTAEIVSEGISKPSFYEYIRKENLINVAHGIYVAKDAWRDTTYILHLRYTNAVFSHEEALYLNNLTDREPLNNVLTFKTGYNPSKLTQRGIKVYTVKAELLEVGKVMLKTSFGNEVPSYNLERTICDIVRSRSTIEIQDYQTAIRTYVKRKDRNLGLLSEYAKLFHIEKLIRQYMEVLT